MTKQIQRITNSTGTETYYVVLSGHWYSRTYTRLVNAQKAAKRILGFVPEVTEIRSGY